MTDKSIDRYDGYKIKHSFMMIKCTQPDRAITAASSERGDYCPKEEWK